MATNAWGLHGYEHHHERSLVDTYWLLPAAFHTGQLEFLCASGGGSAAATDAQDGSTQMLLQSQRPEDDARRRCASYT